MGGARLRTGGASETGSKTVRLLKIAKVLAKFRGSVVDRNPAIRQ
jgi:hypothetical protein